MEQIVNATVSETCLGLSSSSYFKSKAYFNKEIY